MTRIAPHRTRVLVADDHPSIRENLRYLIDAEDDLECVGVVKDPRRCVEMCGTFRPDVLVLDNDMPGVEAIDIARTLSRVLPRMGIVMYTIDPEICSVALAFGATTCVSKNDAYEVLLLAIRDSARAPTLSR